jgi:GAF domain-containing protein
VLVVLGQQQIQLLVQMEATRLLRGADLQQLLQLVAELLVEMEPQAQMVWLVVLVVAVRWVVVEPQGLVELAQLDRVMQVVALLALDYLVVALAVVVALGQWVFHQETVPMVVLVVSVFNHLLQVLRPIVLVVVVV